MTPDEGVMAGMIRPLGAYLPRPDLADQVVAPQYDNLTVEETHRIIVDNPLSFLNVVRSEIDHPEHSRDERRAMLAETAQHLRRLLDGEIFDYYDPPVFFACRLERDGHVQVGLVADVALDAYDRGLVKVHESTRRGQEDRLVEYMDLVGASFLPAFLIHRKATGIDDFLARVVERSPVIDIQVESELRIAFWVVSDAAEVAEVESALASLDSLYIADGHHRAAAASRYAARRRGSSSPGRQPFEHLTSVLFSADQLVVYPYNRCLTDLDGLTADELKVEVGKTFTLVELENGEDPTPTESGVFAMYLDGAWYRITAPPNLRQDEGVAGLAVSVLHDHLLQPILGVVDVRTDPRIGFVPGTMGMDELEHVCQTHAAVAFALAPMDVDDLLAVADRGETMPPKSTWFAPKLRSGLVVRLL